MQRRPFLVVLASGLVGTAALAQPAARLQAGPLVMQWPHGFRPVRRAAPLILTGPDAQEVTVSVHHGAFEPAPTAQDLRRLVERALRLMQAGAESYGEVVVPATHDLLPDGSTLVSAASQWRGFSSNYLLQYQVLAPAGEIACLTVEGRGRRGAAAHQRLLPYFQTVHWLPSGAFAA